MTIILIIFESIVVHANSTNGFRFNSNIYADGKVCLPLLAFQMDFIL